MAEKRHWQRLSETEEIKRKTQHMVDREGKPVYLRPAFSVEVDLEFRVKSSGRSDKGTIGADVTRLRKADRELLEHNGIPYEEPSGVIDRFVDEFRAELVRVLREHMPWDGEI